MKVGQRVMIKHGPLRGERATVTLHPESGRYQHGIRVWLKFDRENARVKVGPAYAVLCQQWYETSALQVI